MAPSNFNFFWAEVLSSGNLFSRSFLQPEVCPLSEPLVCGEQQRWLLAPCSRWLRQTLHQGLFKREWLGAALPVLWDRCCVACEDLLCVQARCQERSSFAWLLVRVFEPLWEPCLLWQRLMPCQTVPKRGLHWGTTNLGENWIAGGSACVEGFFVMVAAVTNLEVSAWKNAPVYDTCSNSRSQPWCTEKNGWSLRAGGHSWFSGLATSLQSWWLQEAATSLQLEFHPYWQGCGRHMLRCAPGSCSLALSLLAGFSSHGKQDGEGRRARAEHVLTWSWDAHPGLENREVLPGPAVQTGPLRAGWVSPTLLFLEQLFRYVCPTACGYDCSSFKITPTHSQQSLPGVFPTSTGGGGDDVVQWPRVQLPTPYPWAWAGSHGLSCCSLFCHMHRASIAQAGCVHTSGLCCCRCALGVDLGSKWACYGSCWVLLNSPAVNDIILLTTAF